MEDFLVKSNITPLPFDIGSGGRGKGKAMLTNPMYDFRQFSNDCHFESERYAQIIRLLGYTGNHLVVCPDRIEIQSKSQQKSAIVRAAMCETYFPQELAKEITQTCKVNKEQF